MILKACPRGGFKKFSATAPSFFVIIVKMLDDADVNEAILCMRTLLKMQ